MRAGCAEQRAPSIAMQSLANHADAIIKHITHPPSAAIASSTRTVLHRVELVQVQTILNVITVCKETPNLFCVCCSCGLPDAGRLHQLTDPLKHLPIAKVMYFLLVEGQSEDLDDVHCLSTCVRDANFARAQLCIQQRPPASLFSASVFWLISRTFSSLPRKGKTSRPTCQKNGI